MCLKPGSAGTPRLEADSESGATCKHWLCKWGLSPSLSEAQLRASCRQVDRVYDSVALIRFSKNGMIIYDIMILIVFGTNLNKFIQK